MKPLLNAIDDFFFRKVSASGFGLMRIAWGAIVLVFLLGHLPDVLRYYGADGLMPQELGHLTFRSSYRFTLLDIVTDPAGIMTLYWMLIGLSFFTMIGLWPRFMTIITVLLLFSFHERNLQPLGGGETVLRIAGFLLMISPGIHAFSVSRLEKQWKHWLQKGALLEPLRVSIWPYRLLLWQTIVIYITSVWDKFNGQMWPAGTTVAAVLHHTHFTRFPEEWMDALSVFSPFFTWSWLLIEASWILLLVPAFLVRQLPKNWQCYSLKRWLLFAGFVYHGGIIILLDVGSFSFAMFVLYLGLLLDSDFAVITQCFNRWYRKTVAVLYDGQCRLCQRSVCILSLLDAFGRLRLVNFRDEEARKATAPEVSMEELDRAMHVKDSTDRTETGFDALRLLAWYLPALWVVLPLLYLPGVAPVGRMMYAKIAKNRQKCADGVCRHS